MFPTFEVKISEDTTEGERPRGRTFDFDFREGDFILRDGRAVPLSGVDALKVWVDKCLRTVAGQNSIYRQDAEAYGVNSFDLTNRQYPFAYLCAEVEREVTEALLRNQEIQAVTGFTFTRSGRTLSVAFTIESVYGTQEAEYKWLTA